MNFENHIKQLFRRFLLSLLILLFTGCVPTEEPNQSPTPSPAPPPVATQTPKPTNQTVGQASTKIFDNISERNQNLALAIKAINGKVLNPGEEFSFNQTVGPRTAEKGYLESVGYDENGEKVPTIGGGVCQISSTLYMAAKSGNFPVTERHSHSHKVPYASSDNDATVSYGGYDFKFQNNLDMPITIYLSTDGASVSAELIVTN